MDVSPFFIVGTERSGSNLLRQILNQHPSIAIPHPPHILKEMMPLEPLYGDLSIEANFRRLARDAARLVELHFSPWDVAIDADEVRARAPGRDVYGVKAAIYDIYRERKGRKRWGCKSTFVIHYVDRVLRHHPQARFIHLVRDGRDVAASARRSVFNHFHPRYVGALWASEQRTAIALARRLPVAQFTTLRYEDLLEDANGEVARVCRFLGEDYSDRLLEYAGSPDARGLASLSRSWENLAKPVMKDNRSKYLKELSSPGIRAFEFQAFAELAHFGYKLENPRAELEDGARRGLGAATRLKYWAAEISMSAYEAVRSLAYDKNASAMLRKRLYVLSLRASLELSGRRKAA